MKLGSRGPQPISKRDLEDMVRNGHMYCIAPDCDGVDLSDVHTAAVARHRWNEHVDEHTD